MQKLSQKLKTIAFWRVFSIAILCLSLLPLLWIAFDNHSVSDDYAFGVGARHAWVETHSLLAVCKAAWDTVVTNFYSWQGTYSAIFLFALQPAIFGEGFYFLSTWILVGTFVFAYFYFFRQVLRQLSPGLDPIADITASVALLCSMQLAPSPVNSFFWWNGSIYYTFFHSLMLLQLANLAVLLGQERCSVPLLLGSLLLGFLIAGGNFITALLMAECHGLALLYALMKKKKNTWQVLVTFMVTLTGFLVSCLAPGNSMRQAQLEGEGVLQTLLSSFQSAYSFMSEYSNPVLVLGLLLLTPFLWRVPVEKLLGPKRRWPLLVPLGLLFALFASSFAPTFYSGIGAGYDRIFNIRYYLWVLLCLAALLTLAAYAKAAAHSCGADLSGALQRLFQRRGASYFISILLCLCLIAGFNVFAGDRNLFASISAAHSLLSGEAAQFDAVADDRIATLLGDGEDVVLPVYPCRPYVLYMGDFDVYRNDTVANFFFKKTVRLDYDLEHTSALGDEE